MIKQLAHVCIHCTDLKKTEKFYCSALGLEKKFEFYREGRPAGFYLNAGSDTFIEVFVGSPAGDSGTIRHICLEADDLNVLADHLRNQGVETSDIKVGADNSRQFWISDPDGTQIEFHEYTETSSQRTGKNAILK